MNICIITEYFPETEKLEIRGGVEARAYHIASQLAKRHTVYVITSSEHEDQKQYKLSGINVIVCSKHAYTHEGALFSRLRFAWRAYKIWKMLQKKDIHIVDGYNYISYLPAYFLGKKLGAKRVATYHEVWLGSWIKNKGLLTGLFGALWEWIVLHCRWDALIAVSAFTKEKLQQHIADGHVKVVPNGIAPELYTHQYKKCAKPTICCISRLTPHKRIDDLLQAVAIIKEHIPHIQCKIIGVGNELHALQQLAKELKIEKHIEFVGFVKHHADVIKMLKQSHVLCHPSIVEGFGLVLLESMASHIPYVCADIPVLRETTSNGTGGLLAEPKNPAHLATQLLTLLQDAEYAEEKAHDGFALAQQYTWEAQAVKVEKIYKMVEL